MTIPDVSIVLVCWNNKAYVDPCLVSLYEAGLTSSFDVVVVDNGSTDGSQEMLREKYPEVMLIQNDYNVGLGKASNQGIEATNGRYILLLNNDTLVNGPSLQAMFDLMDQTPDAGAVGGRLLNPDGSFQSSYASFSTLWEEFLLASGIAAKFWDGYPLNGHADQVKTVGWMSSACLLIRRSTLGEVGLLDETYFIYGDETDLQYRIQKAGWKAYYLPQATTIHFGSVSTKRWPRRRMIYRGKMLFYQKNYGPVRTILLRFMLAVISLAKMLYWSVAWLLPAKREQARGELGSNRDVFQLCLHLV
jgi:N-acetylglucosaminyl-diphospho-decaprenol L-rhamnosyltransferase